MRVEYAGASRVVTSTAPDKSSTVSTYSSGVLISTARYDSSGRQIGRTTYSYDPHGRQSAVTDARNGATGYTYNNADLAATVTTPSPGGIGSPQTHHHFL
jgi:YD repeat-containing protein